MSTPNPNMQDANQFTSEFNLARVTNHPDANGMLLTLRDVALFHRMVGTEDPAEPGWPDAKKRKLRRDLLAEEYEEYLRAEDNDDLIEAADALCDMVYIINGTGLSYGLPLHKAWAEVQRSNMAKGLPCTACAARGCAICRGTGRIVTRRDDGKVLKPDGWEPPNIRRAIFGK